MENWKVLATTLVVTVAGVLIALQVQAKINQAKVTPPTKTA